MINEIKLSDGFRRNFVREVILPLVAILVLTFAGAGAGLFWGTRLTNNEAQEQQQRMIEASFDQSLTEHLRQLRSLTRWAPLANQLDLPQPDQGWLDENVGNWLYEMFDHELVLILGQDNQLLEVWRNGQQVPDRQVGPQVQAMLNSTLLLTSAPSADRADFVRIGDRAASVAVGDISRDSRLAGRYRLVSVKYLDDGYLNRLATRSQLRQLHFSSGTPQPNDRAHYLLNTQQGDPVGYISWEPDRPGAQMLRTIGPSTLLSVVMITLVCLFMVRRIWTSSLNLSQSLLRLGASEAQAQHLAFHDVLTGLPNRSLVEDRLSQALAMAARYDHRVALLLIDLDRFKNINDTYGHHAGDDLIIEVAHRLSGLVRASDTVGRIGGDEFIIVMPDVENIGQVQAVAKRIIDALSEPYHLFGSEAWIGASIGLALAPKDGLDRQELMRKADIALYEAKNGG
ncbi:diguanylate cyclase domain-containing protein, partial [Pantoea sp.]|uniref:diguanylate cyclase domain-containing protein n=1 Tax=Pantoea sp. TaxID=69393 RepID=UPI0028B077EA